MPVLKAQAPQPGEFEPYFAEDDIVDAEVADVRLETIRYKNKETNAPESFDQLLWLFTVTEEGKMKGRQLRGKTTPNFTPHPNCKAYNWAKKITGYAYSAGEEFDTDVILGMPCRVVIGHQKPDDEGRVWMIVKDVFAKRGAAGPIEISPEEAPF